MENSSQVTAESINKFQNTFQALEKEMSKAIVGLDEIVRYTLASVFAGGHVLLEGSPGLGKTLLVRSLAQSLALTFNRIQFTSDLMPSDITGTQVLIEDENGRRKFTFQQGPIFANVILADEVNRAGPKTQSALLEAMEEKQVTVLGTTRQLPVPFFVLATQNPIELEGTYPLPEAQLDRFMVKLIVKSPDSATLKEILERTTGEKKAEIVPAFSGENVSELISEMRMLVRQVLVSPVLSDVLVGIISSLSPGNSNSTNNAETYVRFGPGPRAAQSVLLLSKVFALLDGRINISFDDIKRSLTPALRHRIILNFQAEADNITTDEIIEEVRNAN